MNNTPVGPTQNRLDIYKQIIASKTNDTIRVTLTRAHQEVSLNYVLHEMHQARKQEIGQKKTNPNELTKQKKNR